jgi:hypothetical protein
MAKKALPVAKGKKPPEADDEYRRAYVGSRTTPATYARIKQAAAGERRTVSQWVEFACIKALDEKDQS